MRVATACDHLMGEVGGAKSSLIVIRKITLFCKWVFLTNERREERIRTILGIPERFKIFGNFRGKCKPWIQCMSIRKKKV